MTAHEPRPPGWRCTYCRRRGGEGPGPALIQPVIPLPRAAASKSAAYIVRMGVAWHLWCPASAAAEPPTTVSAVRLKPTPSTAPRPQPPTAPPSHPLPPPSPPAPPEEEVLLELPQQDAVGHELDRRALPHPLVVPHLHRATGARAVLRGWHTAAGASCAAGGGAGRLAGSGNTREWHPRPH